MPYPTREESLPAAHFVVVGEISNIEQATDINDYIYRYHVLVHDYLKGAGAKEIDVYDFPTVPCVTGKPKLNTATWLLHLKSESGKLFVIYEEPVQAKKNP